jgi:hypothetical protein
MPHKYNGKVPKRRRNWHMISKELLRDPEFRELRIQFKDWMGYVWIEMLRQADDNNGFCKGSDKMIAASLTHVSLSKRPTNAEKWILKAFPWMVKKGWIVRQSEGLLIAKYAEYHANEIAKQSKRGTDKTRRDKTRRDETIQEKKNIKEKPDVPDVSIANYAPQFRKVWDAYPVNKRVRMGDAERAWNKVQAWNDYDKIIAGIERWMQSSNWQKDGGKFVPRIADFILTKEYLDKPRLVSDPKVDTAELVELGEQRYG